MDLIEQIKYFELLKPEIDNDIKKDEIYRAKFVNEYSINKIKNMHIDEYVSGKPNSFCYRLEEELKSLGSIAGSFASKKYGVYYNKDIDDYIYLPKFGKDYREAFSNVKNEIINLIQNGERHDLEAIKLNRISPMFKGKILATYYPEDYLAIFDSNELDKFINYFCPTTNSKDMNPVDKRELLVQFKSKNSYLKNYSMREFYAFLYKTLDSDDKILQNIELQLNGLKDLSDDDIPEIYAELENTDAEYIKCQYKDSDNIKKSKSSIIRQPMEFDKQNQLKKEIGNRGEEIVRKAEEKKLINLGMNDKAKLVSIVSSDNTLGYDVRSFNELGEEIHIEVKSTKGNGKNYKFYITQNELEKNNNDNTHIIYLVTAVSTHKPKIYILGKLSNDITLTPVLYSANIVLN